MTATLTLTLDDQALRAALARGGDALGDLTGLMDEIGAALTNIARARFESQANNKAPDGTPWPQSRAARERGNPTLFRSGGLRDSIVYEVQPTSVEVGSNLPYAGIHQFGGTIKPVAKKALKFQLPNGAWVTAAQVTLPARPYLGIGPEEEGDITDITEAYIARAFAP